MNEHEFERAFKAWSHAEASDPASSDLRQRVSAVPLQTSQRRSWLPQPPKWRFGSMFSATKFVVAGAIVALFGGFLLTGVLTQQPSEEPLPPAAASASSSPAATTVTDPSVRSDLLPGVDLRVEAVRPGIFRLLGDGERSLTKNVDAMIATSEGIFVSKHGPNGGARNPRLFRLGTPGAEFRRDFGHLGLDNECADRAPGSQGCGFQFHYRRDGQVQSIVRLGEGTNLVVTQRGDDFQNCVNRFFAYNVGLAADGRCWGTSMGFEPVALSQDGGVVQFGPESLGLDVPSALQGAAIAEDGTVWTVHVGRADLTGRATMEATMDDEGRVLGLAAFDGETWRYVPYEGSARGTGNSPAPFVGPDGTIWVAIPDDEGVPAAVGWDGDEWVELGPESGHIVGYPDAQPLPDGRTLFRGPAILDGSTFRRWDPLRLERRDNHYDLMSVAPDGSVWVVAWEWEPDGDIRTPHLYVITPEAMAATE